MLQGRFPKTDVQLYIKSHQHQLAVTTWASDFNALTGSITLFSGTVTQKPLPGATMFAAVGAATEASARIWGMELAPLRVNTVVPGIIATPVSPSLMGNDGAAQAQAGFAEALPVGRIGTPEDVAHAVEFLIANSFVSGISLVVDCGHRLI
ncbi:MAG: SDR family oxidoreductase [Pseudomonadota bacterium]